MSTPEAPLRDVAALKGLVGGPFGSSLVNKDYKETGVPVIRGTNLGFGRHIGGEYVYVSEKKVTDDLARNTAAPGDLVFTQRGTLGQVAIVPFGSYPKFVVSQSQMRLRVDPTIASTQYLYFACSSKEFRKQIDDNAISTGVPHINLGILNRLTVPLPPLAEQRAIAEVLGALDDKIAANTKLAATAENLSHTLFRSMLGADAHSEPLSRTAQFVNGKAFTKNASGTGRVVIRIAELNSGMGGSTVYNDIAVEEKHLAVAGSILFAWSGSLTLHRWFRAEGIVNQHIFKVIPAQGYPDWLVFELLRIKLDEFKSIAADKATTMGHIQRKHLDEPVLIPSVASVNKHSSLMQALWKQSLSAETENETLSATRDALLPQLMSGKLRVRDAARLVSSVA